MDWEEKQKTGKMSQEYDGSIVFDNQILGRIAPDGLTIFEKKEFCKEIVRRWNHFVKD
jgi:hypothetical protein